MARLVEDPGFEQIRRHNHFVLNADVWEPVRRESTIPFRAQVDTAAWPLFISNAKIREYGFHVDSSINLEASYSTVGGRPLEILGSVRAPWRPGPGGPCLWDTFYVVDGLVHDMLIGRRRWDDVQSWLPANVQATVPQIAARGGTYDLVRDRRTGSFDLRTVGSWTLDRDSHRFFRHMTDHHGNPRTEWYSATRDTRVPRDDHSDYGSDDQVSHSGSGPQGRPVNYDSQVQETQTASQTNNSRTTNASTTSLQISNSQISNSQIYYHAPTGSSSEWIWSTEYQRYYMWVTDANGQQQPRWDNPSNRQ